MDNTQDWDWEEVLSPQQQQQQQQQQLENTNPSSDVTSFPNSDELDRHTSFTEDDVICSDYFSLDRVHTPDPNCEPELELGGGGVESDGNDSGSWMDPTQFSEASRLGKRRRNYSSASESEASDYGGGGLGSGNQLLVLQPHSDCAHHHDFPLGFSGYNHGASFDPLANGKSQLGDDNSEETVNGTEIGSKNESPNGGKYDLDKEGEELGAAAAHGEIINGGEVKEEEEGVHENVGVLQEAEQEKSITGNENGNDNEKSVVWWRVPLEVIKYCVLRVSPVWSLSVAAAAIMGFVMYRRRWLSKMKRKTQGIQLNITVDDKKVSQFMSRAARLNEAFSVVKRVPIIRPALPAPGLTSWPVMSLR